MRPGGLTNTSHDARIHHQDTTGAAVKPAKSASKWLAAMRYVSQRMPTRMLRKIPIRVWKICDFREVGRTVRSAAGPWMPPSGSDCRAASIKAPTRGVA